ncbi:hypothetical protein J7E62_03470 [Variovorax paradoxus]|nr:hypothetical protein [Variovorax paradoxus]
MNPNEQDERTTVADESSAVVDDAQVISKTLPARVTTSRRARDELLGAVEATRGYVTADPAKAMLMAAAAGAALGFVLLVRVELRPRFAKTGAGAAYR